MKPDLGPTNKTEKTQLNNPESRVSGLESNQRVVAEKSFAVENRVASANANNTIDSAVSPSVKSEMITDSEPTGLLPAVIDSIDAMVKGTLGIVKDVKNAFSKTATWKALTNLMSGKKESTAPSTA